MVTYQRRLCLIYNILGEFISCRMFKIKYAQENISLHIIIIIYPSLKFKEHHNRLQLTTMLTDLTERNV